MASFAEIRQSMTLPLICAPMSGVSGPDLTAAACLAGIAGSFPTRNCRTPEQLEQWLTDIQARRRRARDEGTAVGPLSTNLIIRGNDRIMDDMHATIRHGVDFVITSVGSPKDVAGPLRDAGICVLADVASIRHAELALEAGCEGLVLLSAGAGGHTGWANGFAFARAVRAFFDGPMILAGGISDGAALWAAEVLGYDMSYMGTKFIATEESLASPEWKDALIGGSLDQIELGMAPNGVAASVIKGGPGSAGHTISGVTRVCTVAELVDEVRDEYNAAKAATAARLAV